jgi:hypothetical protein
VEKFIKIGKNLFFSEIYSTSRWFVQHIELCKPIRVSHIQPKLHLPDCYIVIPQLIIPDENYFTTLSENADILDILDLVDDGDYVGEQDKNDNNSNFEEDTTTEKDDFIINQLYCADPLLESKLF